MKDKRNKKIDFDIIYVFVVVLVDRIRGLVWRVDTLRSGTRNESHNGQRDNGDLLADHWMLQLLSYTHTRTLTFMLDWVLFAGDWWRSMRLVDVFILTANLLFAHVNTKGKVRRLRPRYFHLHWHIDEIHTQSRVYVCSSQEVISPLPACVKYIICFQNPKMFSRLLSATKEQSAVCFVWRLARKEALSTHFETHRGGGDLLCSQTKEIELQ